MLLDVAVTSLCGFLSAGKDRHDVVCEKWTHMKYVVSVGTSVRPHIIISWILVYVLEEACKPALIFVKVVQFGFISG
jgi:hypothetical protein